MPVSIRLDPESGVAIVSATGKLSRRDAEEAALALWSTPGWTGTAAVWSFEAARFDMSPAEARELAQFILGNQPSPPPRRMAFVTAREADFGMARLFQAYRDASDTAFRVFRDVDEAMVWARKGGGSAV